MNKVRYQFEELKERIRSKNYFKGAYKRLQKPSWTLILVLFALAIVVKLPFAMFVYYPVSYDSEQYANLSINLIEEQFYSLDGENPHFTRPFGYPASLAAVHAIFGVSLVIPVYVQAFLSALEAVVLFIFLSRFFNRAVSSIGYVLFLILPGINFHIPALLSENASFLYLLVFIFFLFYLKDKRNIIYDLICAVSLPLLIYSRTVFIVVVPAAIILLLISNNKILRRRLWISFAVLLLFMAFWGLRNQSWTGEFNPMGSEGPFNMYLGLRTEFDGIWTGWPEPLENGSMWARDKNLVRIQNLPESERNAAFMDETIKTLRAEPWNSSKLIVKNIFRVWLPPFAYNFFIKDYVNDTGYDFSNMRFFMTFIANCYFLFWIILLLMSIIGIIVSKYDELQIFTLSVLVFATLLVSVTGPIARYHTALIPLMLIFTSQGTYYCYNLFRKHLRRYFR